MTSIKDRVAAQEEFDRWRREENELFDCDLEYWRSRFGIIYSINETFIRAVRDNNYDKMKEYLGKGAEINHRDEFGMTPLHHSAAGRRIALRFLVASQQCDYLVQDKWGRYASDIAAEFSRDRAVVRLLTRKREEQAREQGVPARLPPLAKMPRFR